MPQLASPLSSVSASVEYRARFFRCTRRLWLCVSLCACTDFPPIPADVCGNGVLDPGEDCDNAKSTQCYRAGVTHECRFDCRNGRCPDGYGCGVDGVCRLPSNRFEPLELAFGLDVVTAVVGDFDADRRKDLLIGTLDAKTRVTFDAAREPAVNKVSLPSGELSVGDFDRDGRDDVCMWSWYEPVVQLYQSRASDDFVPVTNLFEAPQGSTAKATDYRWISRAEIGDFSRPLVLVEHTLYELDGMDSSSLRRLFEINLRAADVTGHIAVGTLNESAEPSCVQFALAAKGGNGVEVHSTCDAARFETVRVEGRSNFVAPTVFLGHVDADPHFDLVFEDDGITYVGYGVGDGTFHSDLSTLPSRVGDQSMRALFSEGTLLDVGDLDGDSLSDFVTAWTAVHSKASPNSAACGERYCQLLNPFGHSGAQILEMTRDDVADIVAVYGVAPNVGLEFLLGLGDGSFRSFPLRTEGAPAALRAETVPILAGDFDGDQIQDIVFPERRILKGTSQVTATILYGQALSPPREQHNLGALGVLRDFVTVELSSPTDGRTDLVTLSDVQRSRAIGIFEGDPGRAMQSPIRLTSESITSRVTTCSAGRFEKSTQTDAVVTSDRYGTFGTTTFEAQLHVIPGSIQGPTRAGVTTTDLGTNYVLATATLEISPESLDELLVLRTVESPAALEALLLQEFTFTDGRGSPRATATFDTDIKSESPVYDARLHTKDLNADHELDAIVFESRVDRTRVYVFLGDGSPGLLARPPLTLDAARLKDADPNYAPSESAWLNLDADPELELSLIDVSLDAEGKETWYVVLYDLNLETQRLELISKQQYSKSQYAPKLLSGDFDGDGVTDLAAIDSSTNVLWSEPVQR